MSKKSGGKWWSGLGTTASIIDLKNVQPPTTEFGLSSKLCGIYQKPFLCSLFFLGWLPRHLQVKHKSIWYGTTGLFSWYGWKRKAYFCVNVKPEGKEQKKNAQTFQCGSVERAVLEEPLCPQTKPVIKSLRSCLATVWATFPTVHQFHEPASSTSFVLQALKMILI